MTAIQCTEPPSSDANQTRQLLLNDGRQFVLTTASVNNASGATSPPVVTASHSAPRLQVTANARSSLPADNVEVPTDLALRDGAQAAAAIAVPATSNIPPCPFCQRSDFTSNMELTMHVNSSHPDVHDMS